MRDFVKGEDEGFKNKEQTNLANGCWIGTTLFGLYSNYRQA